jgi:hypothetical protein
VSKLLAADKLDPRPEVLKLLEKQVKKSHAKVVEQGIYNYTLQQCKYNDIKCMWKKGPFLSLYTFKVKDMIKNLRDNPEDAYTMSQKSKDELQPYRWETIKDWRKSMKARTGASP